MTEPRRTTRSAWWRSLLRLTLWLLILYLMLRWFEYRQVYHPMSRMDATGAELNRPFEEIEDLRAADGVRLHAWFYPADPGSPREQLVFLLCHGNAGNISHRIHHADLLLETGASVFLLEYRGYGRSAGRPSEEGLYLDAQAGYRWLRDRGFEPAHIIGLGESLGGAVVTELALREPLGGIILLSSFTSIPDVGAELFPFLPVRWLSTIRYDSRSKLPSITVPILIVHSRDDRMIRFSHAEQNFAAAREPKRLLEIQGDHNDFLLADRRGYLNGLNQFLTEIEEAAVE
jgi:uncharacterized protein